MATTKHIAELDIVELPESVGGTPAGARGGVLDIFDDHGAMVEFTNLPGEMDIDKIVVVPLGKLRVVEPARRG
jgi:hypothetical protein